MTRSSGSRAQAFPRDVCLARHPKNLTLTAAATHLHVWPTAISQTERGRRRDDQLAQAYRDWWLNAA